MKVAFVQDQEQGSHQFVVKKSSSMSSECMTHLPSSQATLLTILDGPHQTMLNQNRPVGPAVFIFASNGSIVSRRALERCQISVTMLGDYLLGIA